MSECDLPVEHQNQHVRLHKHRPAASHTVDALLDDGTAVHFERAVQDGLGY